ncbi:MAG: chemotaxis protein CheD [Spirochaeta sp.]|jgi:chemotaxis protein CheD|nr:chemotaxis protein CheD [Spirochaeta sp.]
MNRHFDRKFNRDVAVIHPGEYLVTDDDIIISTVLGSCVAVALYDPTRHQGGLNHFMLPGEINRQNVFTDESGRYGMFAMELLINDMLKRNSNKRNLVAKVFGGGHVLNTAAGKIPESNIAFALEFLETENIPIASSDVGGTDARKIFFFARTSRVLLKRFGGQKAAPVEREEEAYLSRIKKPERPKPSDDVTIF